MRKGGASPLPSSFFIFELVFSEVRSVQRSVLLAALAGQEGQAGEGHQGRRRAGRDAGVEGGGAGLAAGDAAGGDADGEHRGDIALRGEDGHDMVAVGQGAEVGGLEADLDAAALGDVVPGGEGLAVHLHALEGVEAGAADEGQAHVAAVIIGRFEHGDGRAAVTVGDAPWGDGIGEGDRGLGRRVPIIRIAAGAVPILDIALRLGGGGPGGDMVQGRMGGGVLLTVGLAADGAGRRGGAGGPAAGVDGEDFAAEVTGMVAVSVGALGQHFAAEVTGVVAVSVGALGQHFAA